MSRVAVCKHQNNWAFVPKADLQLCAACGVAAVGLQARLIRFPLRSQALLQMCLFFRWQVPAAAAERPHGLMEGR